MHFYFRKEAAAYEIYENNMHTKYSGFTVDYKLSTERRKNVGRSKHQDLIQILRALMSQPCCQRTDIRVRPACTCARAGASARVAARTRSRSRVLSRCQEQHRVGETLADVTSTDVTEAAGAVVVVGRVRIIRHKYKTDPVYFCVTAVPQDTCS